MHWISPLATDPAKGAGTVTEPDTIEGRARRTLAQGRRKALSGKEDIRLDTRITLVDTLAVCPRKSSVIEDSLRVLNALCDQGFGLMRDGVTEVDTAAAVARPFTSTGAWKTASKIAAFRSFPGRCFPGSRRGGSCRWKTRSVGGSWSLLLVAAGVAAAALYGIEDTPNVAGHRLKPDIVLCRPGSEIPDLACHCLETGVMLFHPGIDLADFPSMLLKLSSVLLELVHLPENDLAQVPDSPGNGPDLAPEIVNPPSQLSESGRGSLHVVAEDKREALERQRTVCVSHRSLPWGLLLLEVPLACSGSAVSRGDAEAQRLGSRSALAPGVAQSTSVFMLARWAKAQDDLLEEFRQGDRESCQHILALEVLMLPEQPSAAVGSIHRHRLDLRGNDPDQAGTGIEVIAHLLLDLDRIVGTRKNLNR